MTEAEWLTGDNIRTMLELLRDTSSRRKWRLLLAAHLRRRLAQFPDPNEDLFEVNFLGPLEADDDDLPNRSSWSGHRNPRQTVSEEMYWDFSQTTAAVVRDIFGNPFRPVAFDPAWRSATVTALADAIYAERAFDRLPILADALEDAGCTSADVLEHCRQPGEHVRGCWVVDLVLGKA